MATVMNGQRGIVLLCRAGATWCALPLEFVIETMRALPITPLAGAPPWISGVSVIRGEPLPVVHAGVLLGDTRSRPSRLVTLRAADHRFALAVDEVVGVRALPADVVHELMPLLQRVAPEVVDTIRLLDAELLFVLNAGRLVPGTVWQMLDGEKVST
jgi:purine-binding chemotaxis protein CheW